jgi:hypothetical protein
MGMVKAGSPAEARQETKEIHRREDIWKGEWEGSFVGRVSDPTALAAAEKNSPQRSRDRRENIGKEEWEDSFCRSISLIDREG